jgi:hypothetical protein
MMVSGRGTMESGDVVIKAGALTRGVEVDEEENTPT